MNEIKKYSISGISFAFDEEAYNALKRYLDSLEDAYRTSSDGREIIADIEARIAELILSAQDAQRVVQLPLVQNIIRQLGSAQDISESDSSSQTDSDLDPDPDSRISRRLYRSMEGAKLGGVCIGLGKYFNINPLWIRLGMFLPFLIFIMVNSLQVVALSNLLMNLQFILIVCYVILWFSLPTARSARQKLEMEGRPITARSVAEVTATANDADSKAKPIIAEAVSLFGRIIIIFLKIVAGLFVIGMVTVAIGLFLSLFTSSLLIPFTPLDNLPQGFVILSILILLTPLVLLIYILFCLIISHKISLRASLILFLLWILEIITLMIVTLTSPQNPFLQDHSLRRFKFGSVEMKLEPEDIDEDAALNDLKRQLNEGNLQMNLQIDDNSVKATVTNTPQTPAPKH